MKKFLAFMLCFGLVCGMGSGLVGCDKGTPAKPKAADKDAKPEKDKEKK